ncbi:NAD+ diphosphatase [Pseudaminobacter salicylatoxidans]|uniref:NAD(+) diphosphatase n=1 Tax=Pseudaminobacter salicylatoxidans TaxID=93369 RepID=A0A316C1T7_PSESE|nr:NAD(+) diphosphatase [Pseudaminobacter salicylatoxidans]PWJ80908.1 NAD+ diphosphatase [Pseudaminobacter salicylatoxidans]
MLDSTPGTQFRLFDAPEREPSQLVGFAGNRIDRQAESRDEQSIRRALADPAARVMLMREGRLHIKLIGTAFDPYLTLDEARALDARMEDAVLLGQAGSGPVLAAPAGRATDALPDTMKAIEYRSIYVQGLIDPEGLGAMAQGASLLAWHATHRFCSRCGHNTESRIGGYKRVCLNCNAQHFPRTDPVAIMLTVTRDKCLLGRSPHFAPGMYSALAGFIEPGETIEAAVRRETFEEAGIRLGRVVYHASQPWPFPHTLMIGCFGEALNEDIHADFNELEDCRWFARGEVRDMLARTHPQDLAVPPPGAIATHLIRYWTENS